MGELHGEGALDAAADDRRCLNQILLSQIAHAPLDLRGACQLNSSPLVEGGPASCEGPCRASSSNEGQNSLAVVEDEPYCQVDTEVHPALVQALAVVLYLVRDPVALGAEETAGFEMPGCAAAAVVAAAATAAAASGAAPAAASETEVGEISGISSNPGQGGHQLVDQLPLQYFQFSQGPLLSPLHFLHEHEGFPRSLPYFPLVQVRPALAVVAATLLAEDTAEYLHLSRSCCCCWPAVGHPLQD